MGITTSCHSVNVNVHVISNEHTESAVFVGFLFFCFTRFVVLRNRGYYMTARGYEFYLRVFNSISHSFAALTREMSS